MTPLPILTTAPRRRRLVTLADGTTILLREQAAGDRAQLAQLFAGLSADARYLRFGTGMPPELRGWVLDILCAVDGRDHVGVLALYRGRAIAAGRFIRSRTTPDTAEIALTVTDAWQGRGVGRALGESLRTEALARGVTRFEFEILPINRRAHALARRAGVRPGERHLDLDEAAGSQYSSRRRHHAPSASLRPNGARSSHWYMPHRASSPRA